jgi:hypothetical protein
MLGEKKNFMHKVRHEHADFLLFAGALVLSAAQTELFRRLKKHVHSVIITEASGPHECSGVGRS